MDSQRISEGPSEEEDVSHAPATISDICPITKYIPIMYKDKDRIFADKITPHINLCPQCRAEVKKWNQYVKDNTPNAFVEALKDIAVGAGITVAMELIREGMGRNGRR